MVGLDAALGRAATGQRYSKLQYLARGANLAQWDLDKVYVVVERQGAQSLEACDSIDGHLVTYRTCEEAQCEADDIIAELNDFIYATGRSVENEGYAEDSWTAASIRDASIGDNQDYILMPNEYCGAWEKTRGPVINRSSMTQGDCKCMTIVDFTQFMHID